MMHRVRFSPAATSANISARWRPCTDLSFEVAPGEVLGIGGPKAPARRTLFEVSPGSVRPRAGEIAFDGRR